MTYFDQKIRFNMAVQEFAVHILLARAKRIEHFSWVLETQAQPLYQARIMGRDIRFERMTAAPWLIISQVAVCILSKCVDKYRCFPTKLIPT